MFLPDKVQVVQIAGMQPIACRQSNEVLTVLLGFYLILKS